LAAGFGSATPAALLVGNAADAAQFQTTEASVTSAFNAKFLKPTGSYDRNSQTDNAMPLALGLVPEAQRGNVLSSLVGAVTSAKNQVTAGEHDRDGHGSIGHSC
jgi:alpha-L-rhamnosidase